MTNFLWYLLVLQFAMSYIDRAVSDVELGRFLTQEANSSCSLEMEYESVERFVRVADKRFLWIHMNITAYNVTTSDKGSPLLDPSVVTWAGDLTTYKLLQYPYDFELLSLGILSSVVDHIEVDLNASTPDCTLELGGFIYQIYQAFHFAAQRTQNPEEGELCFPIELNISRTDQFLGIMRGSTGYYCCATEPKPGRRQPHCRVIKQTWLLSIAMVLAIIIFCLFPLYIKYITVGKLPLNLQPPKQEKSGYERFGDNFQDGEDIVWGREDTETDEWIELNGNHGIGLLSLIKSILCFNISSKVASRFRRILFVLLSPSILYIHTALEYHYHRDILQAFLDKGVPISYLAIPFGYEQSRRNWGYVMGGPYILFLLYISSACFLVCIPDSLGKAYCAKAVSKRRRCTFLALNIDFLEKYGLQDRKSRIVGKRGFSKLHAIMMAQFYMLLNCKFWALLFYTWFARGRFVVKLLFPRSKHSLVCFVVVGLILPLALLGLVSMMVLEGILVFVYYGSPVVFLSKTGLHSLLHLYVWRVPMHSRPSTNIRGQCMSGIFAITVAIFLLCTYCIACFFFAYIFIHSFTMIFEAIALTLVGIVLNPRRAVVYLIVGSIILLYLTESVLGFSRAYSDLSRQTILYVEKINKKNNGVKMKDRVSHVDDILPIEGRRYSRILRYRHFIPMIPRRLFLFITERHLPIRREVFCSVMKVICIGCFLELGAKVIREFGKTSNLSVGTEACLPDYFLNWPSSSEKVWL